MLARLDNAAVRIRVQYQEAYCQNLGVRSAPTLVVNYFNAISGAQPVDVYKEIPAELVEQ